MKTPKLLQLARDNVAIPAVFRAETDGSESTVFLHGVIGGFWGDIDETEFSRAMMALDSDTIHLRIDSPGGDVFAARSMMTTISQHKAKVIAHVDGLAASAATGICMACDEVEISQGAGFMIHNAWTIAIGNKNDMVDAAALLEKIDAGLANDYARRTGKTADEITAWMNAETWFTADEARESGFADRVVEVVGKRASNTWNLSAYDHAPQRPVENITARAASRHAQAMRRLSLMEKMPA